jgi:putative ABC transport system permease protein
MTLPISPADLRNAVRLAIRRPGLTLSAVLMLGVVTAAATIVFGMVDAVLLRPLPFRAPGRLVTLWNRPSQPGVPRLEISLRELAEWRARSRSLAEPAVTVIVANEITVSGGGAPFRARFSSSSANFFTVLGVEAALGRTFRPGVEDRPGVRVALLSDALWRRRFGADPAVVGRRLALDGEPFEVVGVLPRDLPLPHSAELWLPLGTLIEAEPQWKTLRIFEGIARLRPGVSPAQASAELTHIALHPRPDLPWRPLRAWVTPLTEEILGDSRDALRLMAGAAGLLLLIACSNVAALLLARAVARQREMALRSALGAGQGRLIGLLLTESLLLAALSTVLALPLAFAGLRLVAAHGPADIPRLDTACLDARSLAFAVTVSLLSIALFGLVPAFEAVRPDAGAALREGERSSAGVRAGRVRLLLVAGQAALAVMVLILAGLTGRSFAALRRADLGFAPAGRLAFHLQLTGAPSLEETAARFRALLARLDCIPGVDAAGAVLQRPLTGPIGWDYAVTLEGQTPRQRAANPIVNHERSSPGYFRTMAIPLLRGRDFTWSAKAGAPAVAVVSRSAAQRLWPGQSPLGKRLLWTVEPERGWLTVVGEVGDVRYREIASVRPDVYVPFQQDPYLSMDVVLRSARAAEELAGPVGRAVHAVDPDRPAESPAPDLIPLQRTIGAAVARPRLRVLLLGTFAVLAVLLAAVGVYGSAAAAVAHRRREIAVRLALGARRGHLLRLALGRLFAAVALGLAAGMAAYALLLADAHISARLSGLLYGIGPGDPAILLAAPACLLAVALCGGLLPVYRALRTEAAEALRGE